MTIEIFFPVQPESVDVAGRLHVRAPYALKDTLKAIPLKRWAPLSKCWTYPATEATAHELWNALRGHSLRMDGDAQELFRRAAVGQQVKQADDGDLPDLPGTTPAWLHQKRAFAFARERDGTMLAMDMGTGKSRTAIGLLDEWGTSRAVILCPRSVIGVWPNQFAQHSDRDWLVLAPPNRWSVTKRVEVIRRQLASAGARPVAVIVNYEASWREPMAGLLELLLIDALDRGALLLDESHKVKAPGGKAAGYATRLSKAAPRRLLLTGTPMPHSPLDIYAQYRALDVDIFGHNFHRFRTRYALLQPIPGTAAQKVVGFQNMDELTRLFASAAFVVKKEDAGLDLPEELHIPDVEVGGRWEGRGVFELEGRSRKAYDTIEGDFILGVKDGTVTVANALTKLLRLQQITSGYVRDDDGVDHEVGREKLDVLDELLEDFAEHEPLVIFARFHHDLARITELCEAQGRRVGEVSGRPTASERWGLNEHSQMRDDIDVCLLQIQSGGVGIDLTRACYAIYYSLDFSLGNYLQSLARVHRPGQTRPVTYYHLIARGTKDEVVYRALRERRDVVEAVLRSARDGEDQPTTQEVA